MRDRAPLGPYATPPRRKNRRASWCIEVHVPGTNRTELAQARTKPAAYDRAGALLRKYGARLDAEPSSLTLSGAAALYVHWSRARRDWTDETIERMRLDLALFVDPADKRLVDVDEGFLEAWLDRLAASGLSLGSQKTRWATSVGFLSWCRRRRLIASNPAELIGTADKPWTSRRGRKRLGRGKAQLRNTAEARAFLEAAQTLPKPCERVAVQLPLLCGLASGEVMHLQVCDIDLHAGVGHVRDCEGNGSAWEVKADARRRTFAIPPHLVPDLLELTAGKDPDAFLFTSNRRTKGGAPWTDKWLWRRVGRVCELAGVRKVCTHGLRGTYSSLLTVHAGASAPEVARYLGHSDDGHTATSHYIGAAPRVPTLHLVERQDAERRLESETREPSLLTTTNRGGSSVMLVETPGVEPSVPSSHSPRIPAA